MSKNFIFVEIKKYTKNANNLRHIKRHIKRYINIILDNSISSKIR